MPDMISGIYLNADAKRVLRINMTPLAPPAPWQKISDDASLGLAAIRRVIRDKGLLADPESVIWQFPAIV